MIQDVIDQVTFTKFSAPYRMGETAGFTPETAQLYVKAGVATLTRSSVPRVDPQVMARDAMHRLDAIAAQITRAERDAKKASADPDASAAAAEALRMAADARRVLDGLRAQQAEIGQALLVPEGRRPAASNRGA